MAAVIAMIKTIQYEFNNDILQNGTHFCIEHSSDYVIPIQIPYIVEVDENERMIWDSKEILINMSWTLWCAFIDMWW
jgi:hypothetical protein